MNSDLLRVMRNKLYGGIEAGGTKFICAIGTSKGNIVARTEITTQGAAETLEEVLEFFKKNSKIVSLGIGSFGPLDLDPASPQFGSIMETPKPGWQNINIKGFFENGLNIPIALDTDVNCSALGEKFFGAANQVENFIYITVGTGIGGSIMIDNGIYNGSSHLEIGHMHIKHEPFDDGFNGVCPYHKDCLEGIASGPAMKERWGKKTNEITNEKAWDFEAQYLGVAISNLILITQPKVFILGGGVMKHPGLINNIRKHVERSINGYVKLPPLDTYIIHSKLEDNGVLGAIKLATLT